MFFVLVAIFITLTVIIKSYKYIDAGAVKKEDVLKALLPAMVAIVCLILRESYFALPEGSMVSSEYLNYRKILLWGFLLLMGYIIRALIYGSVYFYRQRN